MYGSVKDPLEEKSLLNPFSDAVTPNVRERGYFARTWKKAVILIMLTILIVGVFLAFEHDRKSQNESSAVSSSNSNSENSNDGDGADGPLTTVGDDDIEEQDLDENSSAEFVLYSDSFQDGGILPDEFTCSNNDTFGYSPPLFWENEPDDTVELALVMSSTNHNDWAVYHIPVKKHSIPIGCSSIFTNTCEVSIAACYPNSQDYYYHSPCSDGAGPRDYTFTLYALSESIVPRMKSGGDTDEYYSYLDLDQDGISSAYDVLLAVQNVTLSTATLTNMYGSAEYTEIAEYTETLKNSKDDSFVEFVNIFDTKEGREQNEQAMFLRVARMVGVILFVCVVSAASVIAFEYSDIQSSQAQEGSFMIYSTTFEDGGVLPDDFTCNNNDTYGHSPPLFWANEPEDTAELALIMDSTYHNDWAVYHIPPKKHSLVSGCSSIFKSSCEASIAACYPNSQDYYYHSPCSNGPGEKYYNFTLYALSESIVPWLSSSEDLDVYDNRLDFDGDGITSANDILIAVENITIDTAIVHVRFTHYTAR